MSEEGHPSKTACHTSISSLRSIKIGWRSHFMGMQTMSQIQIACGCERDGRREISFKPVAPISYLLR